MRALHTTAAVVEYNLQDGPCDQLLDTLAFVGIPVALLTGYRPNELPTSYLRLARRCAYQPFRGGTQDPHRSTSCFL